MFAEKIAFCLDQAQEIDNSPLRGAGFAAAAGLFAIAQSIFALSVKSPYGALTQAEIVKLKGDDDG